MARLLISALITWRLARMIRLERGPFAIFDKLRDAAGVEYTNGGYLYGKTEAAKAISCFYCLSVWVGLVIAILNRQPLEGFAYSALAILFEEDPAMQNRCYLRGTTPLGLVNTVLGCMFNRVIAKHLDKKTMRLVGVSIRRATEFPPEG